MITWWSHKKTFTLISIKLMWILIFLFTRNRVFKHKGIVYNLHVCCSGLGKMWASYIFHFFTHNSNLHKYEKFNIFLYFICRHVQHSLSGLDNVKMTLPNTYVLTFPSKLLLVKNMFTLTLVDLEKETSISNWDFEMMKVLK